MTIDRGPDSAGCVQFLIDLLAHDDHVICLKGNHEAKLEQFLLHPLKLAPSFFTYGGVQCVQSYGVDISAAPTPDNAIITVHNQLFELIPPSHTSFYSNLLLSFTVGDYFFVHAGVRPGVPMAEQSDADFMHIRSEFISNKALYENVIIHSHTSAYPIVILPNRINVDTCAYDTGVLSCVVLEDRTYRVIEA